MLVEGFVAQPFQLSWPSKGTKILEAAILRFAEAASSAERFLSLSF